jgi:Ring finger domain
MASLLRCFCRVCCDEYSDSEDEQESSLRHQDDHDDDNMPIASRSSLLQREAANNQETPFSSPLSTEQRSPPSQPRFHHDSARVDNPSDDHRQNHHHRSPLHIPAHRHAHNTRESSCCCRDSRRGYCEFPSRHNAPNIHDFFRHFSDRWRLYDVLERTDNHASDDSSTDSHSSPCNIPSPPKSIHSPLKPARSFDASQGTLTIGLEEVVLPGSDLQKEMARTMSLTLEKYGDECVICMEGFTPDNPRMPTLCGCGENKTYFHLPCLYQWVDQSPDCPSCRQKLQWEEY